MKNRFENSKSWICINWNTFTYNKSKREASVTVTIGFPELMTNNSQTANLIIAQINRNAKSNKVDDIRSSMCTFKVVAHCKDKEEFSIDKAKKVLNIKARMQAYKKYQRFYRAIISNQLLGIKYILNKHLNTAKKMDKLICIYSQF